MYFYACFIYFLVIENKLGVKIVIMFEGESNMSIVVVSFYVDVFIKLDLKICGYLRF